MVVREKSGHPAFSNAFMGTRDRKQKRWLIQHRQDFFVKKAQEQGYRARAVFKLLEIDERDQLFADCYTVVDLGAAPGAWSQLARQRIPHSGKIVALDRLEMLEIPGVSFIHGDFRKHEILGELNTVLGDTKVDLVMSDMAPNISGIRVADQASSLELAELAADFAYSNMRLGGTFLVKLFEGSGTQEYISMLRKRFIRVMIRKPKASRPASRELYALARGYRV